jgi:hypothetical protein
MSNLLTLALGLFFSFTVTAQDVQLKGFNDRFILVKDSQNKVTAIKLKKVVSQFTIRPFIEQVKRDILEEQKTFTSLTYSSKEDEINSLISDLGINPYQKGELPQEIQKLKEALLHIPHINVEQVFNGLAANSFWNEFQQKLQEAFLFIDPTILANLEDPRFFYKKNVTYKVVEWGMREAQKRFSSVPVLNIAMFVIVRVHDMMLEQRHFHHNMLLHYFENIPETKLGMTKEEVDRAVSSIYEYRIDVTGILESNRAAADWINFGINQFYMGVRSGNARISELKGPLSDMRFENIKKLNFGFIQVTQEGVSKIYHLQNMEHQFSQSPALAFDFSEPKKVKRNRALLNLGGVAIGFIQMPGWLKSNIEKFIKSCYVNQVRTEGALIGHFESTGNNKMINEIYDQRANFYIIK